MHVLSVDYKATNAPLVFCESLKKTGFAVIKNHPISVDLILQSQADWRDFFLSDKKDAYLYQKPKQDGYFPFRTENAKDSSISDLKEFFHYYPWGKVPPELEAVSQQLFVALKALAAELLEWVEQGLDAHIASKLSMPLKNMINDSHNTLLRILHYPPLPEDRESGAVRAAPHEDINLITLLPAASAPGLEVKDLHGKWHAVDCDPGNIVVNVGDMLEICTQGYFKSTTHRVTNPHNELAKQARFSMPLFLHPNAKVLLTENQTAEEFLHERLRAIGIY